MNDAHGNPPPHLPIGGPWKRYPHGIRGSGGRRFSGKPRLLLRVAIVMIPIAGILISAIRDLSRPEAWAYWKDLYFAPSLTATVIPNGITDSTGRRHKALAVQGAIGPAAASWFRGQVAKADLQAGDGVVLSSPGGLLDRAMIMGEIIRSRGLITTVGTYDSAGHLHPSYCASACVMAFAGSFTRMGFRGSSLGVHRFTETGISRDPVADAQRTTGLVLGYLARMGVSAALVEAMPATSDVRWLGPSEAKSMNLVTDFADYPGKPGPS